LLNALPNFETMPSGVNRVAIMAWPYRRGESAEPQVHTWLSKQLGVPESRLQLMRDPYGRPYVGAIDDDLASITADIDINWSHSGDWLIAGYAHGAQVGIDLELVRPRPKALAIARRFFAPEETAVLEARADEPDALQSQFTRLWCAKEAVLKAHGRGLSFGLHRLHFAMDGFAMGRDADTPRMIACDPALGVAEDWQLHAWAPQPGYWATLAIKHRLGID
jgi:4'-phosphopantetheinyl transferase